MLPKSKIVFMDFFSFCLLQVHICPELSCSIVSSFSIGVSTTKVMPKVWRDFFWEKSGGNVFPYVDPY